MPSHVLASSSTTAYTQYGSKDYRLYKQIQGGCIKIQIKEQLRGNNSYNNCSIFSSQYTSSMPNQLSESNQIKSNRVKSVENFKCLQQSFSGAKGKRAFVVGKHVQRFSKHYIILQCGSN